MKKLELYLLERSFKKAVKIIESKDLPKFVEEMESDGSRIYHVDLLVPDEILNELIQELMENIDFRFSKNIMIVSSIEAGISTKFDRIKEKLNRNSKIKPQIPIEKLLLEAKKYTKVDVPKLTLTVIAGLIALIGLFLNNIAIIIGAMLLSPILGPIYSFSINSALGKVKDSLKALFELLSFVVVVTSFSALLTFMLRLIFPLEIGSEILLRSKPSSIYVIMTILLGFAAIMAMAMDIPEILAGIAIAAAVLPPSVVVGISIGTLSLKIFLGSLLLTLENILGLLIGSLLAPLILNIGPRRYYEKKVAKRYIFRVISLLSFLTTGVIIIDMLARHFQII
ncbi:MAG: TIGR00341 family protein [Candidatus Baldrarchaeia archaeon]